MRQIGRWMLGLAAVVAAGLATPASAQSWPTQRVTIVVPFGAGSVTDILARIFADEMGQALGPAGHRREPARPRRHRCGRQGGARRLHADGDVERPHRRRPGREGRAVRSGEGLRRHHPARLGAAVPDLASGRSGEDPQGGHRSRQGSSPASSTSPRRASPARRSSPARSSATSPASTSSMCRSAARRTR